MSNWKIDGKTILRECIPQGTMPIQFAQFSMAGLEEPDKTSGPSPNYSLKFLAEKDQIVVLPPYDIMELTDDELVNKIGDVNRVMTMVDLKNLQNISKVDFQILKQYFANETDSEVSQIPFHCFLSPQCMTNYRYKWVPYELPANIRPVLRSPFGFNPPTKLKLIELISGSPRKKELKMLIDQDVSFVEPNIPQLCLEV
ncbi:hypothetical protein HK098_003378 [Nowakowskiella sp. JEL0407]|nr:hypothetical protein HK098_003378 [Nowakowskiella sp. JEL0407]